MIDLDTAFALYRDRIARATLDDWPEVWAAHFAGERILGEMSAQVDPLIGPAHPVFWVMSPFAYTVEMTDAIVVFDAFTAAEPHPMFASTERCLYVSRLSEHDGGHQTTHWVIPYSVLEGGIRIYDLPQKSSFFVPKLNEALGLIVDTRFSRAVYSYDESVAAAIRGREPNAPTDL